MSTGGEISEAGQIIYGGLTAKKINSLLNSLKTRAEGLELLNLYLPQCPEDDFLKYCISWMQTCCKVDNIFKNRDYSIKLLGTLFQISSNYQELKKSVSFFITTRYFDYVVKYFLNSEAGWACTEITLSLYRGACGPFKETLEKHLKNELKKNGKISSTIAKCFALLPSIGGAGNENLNYQRNWKIQFQKFVNVSHLILDNLFLNVEELQEYEISEDYWTGEENQQNPEYLTFQLYNYCRVLNYMLLSKYPAPKAVPADMVFQLIGRGLAINVKSLGKQETTDIIALQKMLPDIHNTLLSLLKALIVTCKNQLLPYAYLICKLLRQSLECPKSEFSYSGDKPFGQVRISVYETLCNWLIASRSGGCVESISNIVVANATADISPKKDVVVLKESKQKLQSHMKEQNLQVNAKGNEELCFAALKSLQFLLKFVGVLLKPEEHKFLQEFTIKLLVDIQKTSTSLMLIPFSASKCRKELYSLLLQLIQHPCPQWPPPTHYALRLFRKGVADECPQVSFVCSHALNVVINLIHPQYNNGPLSSEAQEAQREWTSQTMEIDTQIARPESENEEKTPESNSSEEIGSLDKSNQSLEEFIIETVTSAKDGDENEALEKKAEEDEVPVPKKPRMAPETEHKTPEKDKHKTPEKDEHKTPEKDEHKTPEKDEHKTPEKDEHKTPEKDEHKTPEKDEHKTPEKEKITPEKDNETTFEEAPKKLEEYENIKSVTPEVNEEKRPKKTYFLRSKTKGSSEESEGGRSPDNLRNTPLRGLIRTASKRLKTRALSKVEVESETESKMTKKSEDDEEDILAAFDDSVID